MEVGYGWLTLNILDLWDRTATHGKSKKYFSQAARNTIKWFNILPKIKYLARKLLGTKYN